MTNDDLQAGRAAAGLCGVTGVDNGLQVRMLNRERRDDAGLRGDVLQALMLDRLVPTSIDAKVEDGFVTLTGTAGRHHFLRGGGRGGDGEVMGRA